MNEEDLKKEEQFMNRLIKDIEYDTVTLDYHQKERLKNIWRVSLRTYIYSLGFRYDKSV